MIPPTSGPGRHIDPGAKTRILTPNPQQVQITGEVYHSKPLFEPSIANPAAPLRKAHHRQHAGPSSTADISAASCWNVMVAQ